MTNTAPQTWHYGIVAQHWAEFHLDGPEIAYYQMLIERYGQPALDVGCGTGRLLLPYLQAGFDEINIQGDFTEADAAPEHGAVVFIAKKQP